MNSMINFHNYLNSVVSTPNDHELMFSSTPGLTVAAFGLAFCLISCIVFAFIKQKPRRPMEKLVAMFASALCVFACAFIIWLGVPRRLVLNFHDGTYIDHVGFGVLSISHVDRLNEITSVYVRRDYSRGTDGVYCLGLKFGHPQERKEITQFTRPLYDFLGLLDPYPLQDYGRTLAKRMRLPYQNIGW